MLALLPNHRARRRLPSTNWQWRLCNRQLAKLTWRLLLLPLLDRPRCVRHSHQDKRDTLQNGRSRPRPPRAVFRSRPGPLLRPPGQVRFSPVRGSRCRGHLRKLESRMQLLRRHLVLRHRRKPPVQEWFPACRRRRVPRLVRLLLRPRPSCRELPWAPVVRCGLPRNRIWPVSRLRGRSFRRVRTLSRN
jgi:hypothetical protein